MKRDVRKVRTKEERLMQLYSLWQETRRGEVQQKCVGLLGQVLHAKPGFSLRREFQTAF